MQIRQRVRGEEGALVKTSKKSEDMKLKIPHFWPTLCSVQCPLSLSPSLSGGLQVRCAGSVTRLSPGSCLLTDTTRC